jgi:hypothetical protein
LPSLSPADAINSAASQTLARTVIYAAASAGGYRRGATEIKPREGYSVGRTEYDN